MEETKQITRRNFLMVWLISSGISLISLVLNKSTILNNYDVSFNLLLISSVIVNLIVYLTIVMLTSFILYFGNAFLNQVVVFSTFVSLVIQATVSYPLFMIVNVVFQNILVDFLWISYLIKIILLCYTIANIYQLLSNSDIGLSSRKSCILAIVSSIGLLLLLI